VASNVLRTHADTVCLLAFAAASTRFRSSRLNRTGTMLPLASLFASLGRPGFFGFGCLGTSQLLHDGNSDSGFRRYSLGNFENGYVTLWLPETVRFVWSQAWASSERPCIPAPSELQAACSCPGEFRSCARWRECWNLRLGQRSPRFAYPCATSGLCATRHDLNQL
jgi:hypothetical protein